MRRLILIVVCLASWLAASWANPVLPPPEATQARGSAGRVAISSETTIVGGRHVDIWRPDGDAPAPLIVFSHGFAGCGRQSTFLTSALAEAGYLVVAPRHADAWCGKSGLTPPEVPFWEPQSWSDATYRDRRDDIVAVLDAMRRDPDLSGRIDWSRLGLMGHSLGGYTVLGLAGGWPSWRIQGVKAVLALSPYCAPFLLAPDGLSGIAAPVMYQGGTFDIGITPFVSGRRGCFEQTPAPAEFVEFRGAGHLAWTDLVATDHADMVFYARAFFDTWLRGQRSAPVSARRGSVVDLREK